MSRPVNTSNVNLRGVNFSVHRSAARGLWLVALALVLVGFFAGLTFAGWIAGIKP